MPDTDARNQLLELAATNLGVIEHLGLVFGPGLTAITGETGAGKTLVLTALDLLIGGRSDPAIVGPHGDEAVVEGRFLLGGDELVLQRVVPRNGRSRAYVNGRLATATALAEHGKALVEIHGQHGHTALAHEPAQRLALDGYAGIDIAPLRAARAHVRELRDKRDTLGGDERERLRQIELYRFQVDEIDAAGIVDGDEDTRLQAQERFLGDATGHAEALGAVVEAIAADGPASAAIDEALGLLRGREPLTALAQQLTEVSSLLGDAAAEARGLADGIEADPEALAAIQERRRVLSELRRKYGDTLDEVVDFGRGARERLSELEDHARMAAEIDDLIAEAEDRMHAIATAVGDARRKAAPALAEQCMAHLHQLALPNAKIVVDVGPDSGDHVDFLVSMNTGTPPQSLAKVASGGELARTMLSLRLVMSGDPAVMVFDEVDAGIGGTAAHSVGAALARLALDRQVLVVTHLAQVAAFADQQISVVKTDDGSMVSVSASSLGGQERVVELSRMLSGTPDSSRAREHAAELLEAATVERRG